jgi:hypothetical protein
MYQSQMIRVFLVRTALVCAIVTAFAGGLRAAPIVTPAGLNPGDSYRLAFMTSGVRDALSSNIADYNAFVAAAANAIPELAALATTWRAIGSTLAVDARDNTNTNPFTDGVGTAIYSLDGVDLIAANNADLWDGLIVTGIRETENGVIENNSGKAWTGTDSDGTALAGATLGETFISVGSSPFFHSAAWIRAEGQLAPNEFHLYAISGVLIAPATEISEPVAPFLILLGMGAVWVCRRKFG